MAHAAGPGARVVGIERSAEQLAEALRQAAAAGEAELVELRPGDALAPPLAEAEWGSFDVVHARFLLEHLRNPLDAVRVMVRAARPGGRLILQDDDHALLTLHPEPAGFTTLWTAYMRSYDRVGNDPYIGRRLVALLHEAGAQPTRATLINFGAAAGDPLFDTWCENLARIFSGARELVLREALCDAATWDAGVAALEEWRRRPDAAAWYGVCWAEGEGPGRRGVSEIRQPPSEGAGQPRPAHRGPRHARPLRFGPNRPRGCGRIFIACRCSASCRRSCWPATR
jgi:SAM-dependent methyltransferase